ncbi:MAG: WbqC family protein [Bacteroidales bacterium]
MNTTSILLSSAYLPPISYFQALSKAGKIYIDAQENYQKQSFRNRAQIVGSHGVLSLSVPIIQTDGNHTPMGHVGIANQMPWQRSHWRSMEAAYNNSPFFLYYKDELSEFYQQPYTNLMQLNEALLRFFIRKLHWSVSLENTSEFIPYHSPILETEKLLDLRLQIHPKRACRDTFTSYIRSFDIDLPLNYQGNISVLDLLCNLGGDTSAYLRL